MDKMNLTVRTSWISFESSSKSSISIWRSSTLSMLMVFISFFICLAAPFIASTVAFVSCSDEMA